MRHARLLIAICFIALGTAGIASAQDSPAATPTPAPAAAPTPPTPLATGSAGAASQTSNYFNPSVSVIGNFLAVGGQNPVENLPSASLRESELGVQAVVDPYARADFFISFGEHDVSVEEGFVTFTALPADLLVKVGRMRVSFGKVNTMHLHVMPWPDEPLPVVNLLGGEEGWIGTGASVAKLLPLPGDVFSELTLQVFGDEPDGPFVATKRSQLAYNGHYRVFADLSDSTNLDFGVSYGQGPNGTSSDAETTLGAVDATLRWKPLVKGNYRSAILRGEYFLSRRDQSGGTVNADGWFVSGEYQLAKRWWVGVRGEASQHADNAAIKDTGTAATVTFWPSEFSQLRAELRQRRYGGPNSASTGTYTANEVLFQLQFAIGAHGAHPF
ncbi:MAG: hypothetical protein ABR961_08060 [Thermoanaerobaculaceae bacterium]